MKQISKLMILSTISLLCACGSGASSSTSDSGFVDKPVPPSPYPSTGSYNGIPYSQLGQPTGLSSYPDGILPKSLQIAYGYANESSAIANLTAFVAINSSICTATPIKYDSVSNTTFLVSAAHCFIHSKENASETTSIDMIPVSDITVSYGSAFPWIKTYQVNAVYIPKNYCFNSTFAIRSECSNFSPNSGSNTQGNDIAILQIKESFGIIESYPKLAEESQYPQTYSMAPVLSVGYGLYTQEPITSSSCTNCGNLYYVANYQYWQQDATGYHYLYNSYYANNSSYGSGYAALSCDSDSGGGDLFWDGKNWLLLSEHAYGPTNACGTLYSYLPNAATNVSAYYEWIKNIIDNTDPKSNCKNGSIANCTTNN